MTLNATQVLAGDPRSLRDQVRDVLRSWIISGRLEPGSRVRESEVATDLGISRVPVREAIAMLEAEGLLTSVPRRGVLVKRLQVKDVEDLFDIREALEGLAAGLAARRAQPADLRRIRWVLSEARVAADENDHSALSAANLQFHGAVSELAGNPALSSMLEVVGVRLRWDSVPDRDAVKVLHEHEQLLDAIGSGDADRASRLATEHVQQIRMAVVPGFAEPLPASAGTTDDRNKGDSA